MKTLANKTNTLLIVIVALAIGLACSSGGNQVEEGVFAQTPEKYQ